MGELMRTHDWSASPLGAPETWPQSLRTAVGMVLGSKFPSCLVWGPDLITLYNDAFRPILGIKPEALGRPFSEVWSEAWDTIGPIADCAFAGEPTLIEDFPLIVERHGYPEQTYFTFCYSPVRDETGNVAGFLDTVIETTGKVLAEQRQGFRLALEERLRGVTEPRAVMAAAVEALGRHLGANRVGYSEVQAGDETIVCDACFVDGVEPLIGTFAPSDFGSVSIARQRQGLTEVCNDVEADPAQVHATWAAIETRSFVSVPLLRDGRLTATLYVNFRDVHHWTAHEIALVEEVAARTCVAVERARVEGALRQSEAHYRALFENIDVGYSIHEVKFDENQNSVDYRVVEANPAFERQTGLVDAVGKWVSELTPGIEQHWIDANGHVLLTGEPVRIENYVEPLARWYDVHIFRTGEPREPRVAVLFNDISERKIAEQQLRELNATLEERVAKRTAERNLLATIVEVTDIMVLAVDLDFNILAINTANADEFERIYGVRPKAGDNMLGLLADQPEHQEQVRAGWAQGMRGESVTFVEDYGDPGRVRPYYEVNFQPLRNEAGEQIGVYQFVIDVTQRVRGQAQLAEAQDALHQSQKMDAMGQLTGGVAHDVNNLLTPIVGGLDLLQRKGLGGGREQRLIAGALASAERVRVLVQRLLAFARRQPLQPQPVDVGSLIAGMADLIASTSGPQVKVTVDTASDLPAALADPNQLEMAILNLAVNARDAMPNGGQLTISARAGDVERVHSSGLAAGSYIRLSVADTGTGMDAETLKRAVEPFFSTKGIGRGTGLGLSMVHGLAAQLGGTLTINSKPGLGTNVELWLPATEAGTESAERPGEPEVSITAGTVLLVDDEELVRASTADMLVELGYTVVEAMSAEEALRLLEDGLVPDVVVTDHLMPGMTGTELARELHRRLPGIGVLIISGYADVEGVAPDLPRLVKPFRQAELAASLAALGKS
ncbi:PAS domain-containing protein [Microvirga aerilata]|uniref:histidine kinase n=1 Tax=Microvirga aerilata TaxID=670292 RepID=A0A937D1S9_9HYPH|nr:PAS domain-containing protein [Microvirga aerilata]MBL0407371.1 PAS domain-containing protein [Microvirga aerilata]